MHSTVSKHIIHVSKYTLAFQRLPKMGSTHNHPYYMRSFNHPAFSRSLYIILTHHDSGTFSPRRSLGTLSVLLPCSLVRDPHSNTPQTQEVTLKTLCWRAPCNQFQPPHSVFVYKGVMVAKVLAGFQESHQLMVEVMDFGTEAPL